MALVLVPDVGSASANSFVSLAEAEAYIEGRMNAGAWDSSIESLVEATRDVSVVAYLGYRADDTQALSWPRRLARNPDASVPGTLFDSDVIPTRVKEATIELALEYLRAGTVDVASLPSTANVIRRKVDVLETEYSHPSQRPKGLARYPRVLALLGPLMAAGSGQPRLVR